VDEEDSIKNQGNGVLKYLQKSKWELFLDEDWPKHKIDFGIVSEEVHSMQAAMIDIKSDTRHLPALDNISGTLREIKDGLLQVVSGKNVVDVDTVKGMLKAQQDVYTTMITTICKLLGVIIVVLLGVKLLAPYLLGG